MTTELTAEGKARLLAIMEDLVKVTHTMPTTPKNKFKPVHRPPSLPRNIYDTPAGRAQMFDKIGSDPMSATNGEVIDLLDSTRWTLNRAAVAPYTSVGFMDVWKNWDVEQIRLAFVGWHVPFKYTFDFAVIETKAHILTVREDLPPKQWSCRLRHDPMSLVLSRRKKTPKIPTSTPRMPSGTRNT